MIHPQLMRWHGALGHHVVVVVVSVDVVVDLLWWHGSLWYHVVGLVIHVVAVVAAGVGAAIVIAVSIAVVS